MSSWVEKYRPTKVKEVIGQAKAVDEALNFVENFSRQKKKALILYGPTGCGKTALPYALAEEKNAELIEINASDIRNKDGVLSILAPATQQMSLFGANKIVLIDEVEGLSGTKDRGGVPALASIIPNTKFPIIITTDDPYAKKLQPIRKLSNMIQLRKMNSLSVEKRLRQILNAEGLEYEDMAVKKLAELVDGDLRAGINDLQTITAGKNKLELKDVNLLARDTDDTIFNLLKFIFKSFDTKVALQASDDVPEDFDNVALWLDQNIPYEYYKPKELKEAYDSLSLSNIFSARIRRWQHWRFLVYQKFFQVAGVQLAKDDPNPGYITHRRPEIMLKMFIAARKKASMKAITFQLSKKLNASSRRLQKTFYPYYKFMRDKNPQMFEELNEYLEI